MNINKILTKIEYTKERSPEELFEFVKQKEKELSVWSRKHLGTKTSRKMKYKELDKELPYKFRYELTPFAYFANTYYGNKPGVTLKPCCGSERYDGIIVDNNKEYFVEITDDIDGRNWSLSKELLEEKGWSPVEDEILGVKGNKTKRKRTTEDINSSEELVGITDVIRDTKKRVKDRANKKCKKSIEQKLPYGQDKTILIVTFEDKDFSQNDRNDFVNFKQAEIDSMKHNFIKIFFFGWTSKKFIPEHL